MQTRIGLQQTVLDAFVQTQTRLSDILQMTQAEGESGEFFVHFSQERSSRLHFQQVLCFHIAFEHGNAQILRTGITVTGTHGNIDGVDFVLFKFAFGQLFAAFNFFGGGRFESNFFNAIQNISFHLVHASGCNGLDIVGIGNSFDGQSNIIVLGSSGNGLGGNQHGIVSAYGHISHFRFHLDATVLVGYHYGVCRHGNVSINVTTQINFHYITSLERISFFTGQW
mmetsp:Transcript_12012/g.24790  ORF Transcript_12012/g.24790 Transcript_12012/m.24790 type:complete len:225 (-) Transcript_12012:882-1556(-)